MNMTFSFLAGVIPILFIKTDHENCRKCYACVRACPVKTIAIKKGLPEIIEEGCLTCGRCVLACSIGAKVVQDDTTMVQQWIAEGQSVAAIVAPSFPASFAVSGGKMVSALQRLGFSTVQEVAYGAGICAKEYANYFRQNPDNMTISTACPAVVQLVEKHFPSLLPHLAPIDSPMLIQSKIVKSMYPDHKIVFIGPCLAKKHEAEDANTAGYVDAVITFRQLNQWFVQENINCQEMPDALWDNPKPELSRTFPISGGLLKSSNIQEDIASMEIIVVEGAGRCIEVLKAVENGEFTPRFLDMLICEGCVMGPGMLSDKCYVVRARQVAEQIDQNQNIADDKLPEIINELTFERVFTPQPLVKRTFSDEEIWQTLKETGKHSQRDLINCSACGYDTCWEKAVACLQGMAEKEMCLPFLLRQVPSLTNSLMDMSNKLMLSMESINFSTLTLKGTTNKMNIKNRQLETLLAETNAIASDTLALANKVLTMVSEYQDSTKGQGENTKISAADMAEIKQIAAQSKLQSENATRVFQDIASVLTRLKEDSDMILEQERAIKVVTNSLEQIVATYDQLLNIGAAMANIGRNYT